MITTFKIVTIVGMALVVIPGLVIFVIAICGMIKDAIEDREWPLLLFSLVMVGAVLAIIGAIGLHISSQQEPEVQQIEEVGNEQR